MKLYKYTNFDIGKSIIETSKVALSKPEWFNDPFDSIPVMDDGELQRAIDVMNGYLLDAQVFKILRELRVQLQKRRQRILVSFILAEFRFAQRLAKIKPVPYHPVCTFSKLNKLLSAVEKCGRLTPEQIVAKEKLLTVQMFIETREWNILTEMMNMRDRMYVSCLSATYDSILMWSYYGQDHRGLCLEFEIDENSKYLSKVEYQTERPTMQLEKLMRNFCGQLFAQRDMSNVSKDPTLLPLVVQPYITKSKEWEHEQEFRLIYLEEAFSKEGIEECMCDDGKERYMCPVKITKVFFGANMSYENKKALRETISSKIEIVEMNTSNNKYKLLSQ